MSCLKILAQAEIINVLRPARLGLILIIQLSIVWLVLRFARFVAIRLHVLNVVQDITTILHFATLRAQLLPLTLSMVNA